MFGFRHRYSKLMLLGALLGPLSGCSLLDISLDSQSTPLTTEELNTRLQTREYAVQFFAQIEQAADHLHDYYPKEDKVHQSYILLWKINAEEGMQHAAYQLSPIASLIDSWVFAHQMAAFFNTGAGNTLFSPIDTGDHQGLTVAQVTANHLQQAADEMARSVLTKSEFDKNLSFVEQFAKRYPFADLSFIRTPAYHEWLKANGISARDAVTTLGTIPEAIGDVSNRLALAANQGPKLLSWKAELIALNSTISTDEISAALNSVQATSQAFQDFVNNNPEYMEDLAKQMAIQLQPLVTEIDSKTSAQLAKLSQERMALDTMVARERSELVQLIERERKALAEIVDNERQKIAQDLDTLAQDAITQIMQQLTTLIKQTAVYLILVVLVIFFAPLGLGYALGRRSNGRRNEPRQ
ncbi:chemotaxis protein [Vibrio sp. SM6]|uniref:Chemotaxis protein n=1 Tax=Vibrio agarilyticus TaxID=2726741 RepID=A0A7X8TNT9_9VIBR|nr:chemotaxis protein [Vibrio agarilyticus]NLS11866.1 chemotaxis protein [Vibrio agarilyticus]